MSRLGLGLLVLWTQFSTLLRNLSSITAAAPGTVVWHILMLLP